MKLLLLLLGRWNGVSIRTPGIGVAAVKLWWTSLLRSRFSRLDGKRKCLFLDSHQGLGTQKKEVIFQVIRMA